MCISNHISISFCFWRKQKGGSEAGCLVMLVIHELWYLCRKIKHERWRENLKSKTPNKHLIKFTPMLCTCVHIWSLLVPGLNTGHLFSQVFVQKQKVLTLTSWHCGIIKTIISVWQILLYKLSHQILMSHHELKSSIYRGIMPQHIWCL